MGHDATTYEHPSDDATTYEHPSDFGICGSTYEPSSSFQKKLAALLMSCPAISEICSSCRYIRPRVGFRIDKQSPLRTIYSKSFPTQNNRTIFPKPSPAQSHLSKSFLTQTTNQPIQFDSHSLQPDARGFWGYRLWKSLTLSFANSLTMLLQGFQVISFRS